MDKIRSQLGDMPTYFTFDVDAIDPTNCPGAGEYYSQVVCNRTKEQLFFPVMLYS